MALLCSVAVQVAPLRLCFYLLFYLLLISLFTHITSALITYDKSTLLDIGNRFTNLVQDTLSPNPNPSWPLEILRNTENKDHRRQNKKHRGNSAGICNRLRKRAHSPPLPSILLANVQSLENKMDDLRARISFQRDIRDCNIICLTETWLTHSVPDFHQHVSCPTRGPNTLDHCYSQFKNAYKACSLPAFGKSDHAAIFLTPEYKQRLAQEPPVKREVTRWSSHSEAMLQAALDDVDWDMFRASSSDVSEFTDVAVSFVNTLTEQATETITVRTFPNQKPWVDRTIRDAVNKRTAAYNEALLSGNMSVYKASCYALRRAVSAAKHRYKERIESHFQLNDSRRMWQGLRTICAFGNKSSAEVRADPSLADELNTFYGCIECNGGSAALPSSASGSSRQRSENHVITVSEDEVRRALKRVNIRKAAGPDGITGRVLRSCADQLAGLFTSIFNL